MIRLGIIGNSGRGNDMTREMFEKAKLATLDFIRKTLKRPGDEIFLISGGSAWMDHVAVSLYHEWEFAGIKLYLPAVFVEKFDNTYEGRRLNELHKSFSLALGKHQEYSMDQIAELGASSLSVTRGFFERNSLIAENCDILLAFTFGITEPNPGGTLDTWKKFKGEKYHFSLQSL